MRSPVDRPRWTSRWSQRRVSDNVGYLAGVDHLRGLAAVLMVVYHGYQQLGGPQFARTSNPAEAVLVEGHTAVALFMVLSGFIFTYGALGAPAGSTIRYGAFVRNRLLRVGPMYLLVVALAVLTTPEAYSFEGLVQLLTLQGTPPIAQSDFGPFGALLWTVSVELAFYLVFPFLFRFLVTYGPLHLVGLVVLLNVLRATSHQLRPDTIRDLSYWTIVGRLDQFLVGMLLGWLVVRVLATRPPIGPARAAGAVVLATAVVVGVLVLFNRHGSWPVNARWKVVWPLVEGLAWGLFVVAWLLASRWLPRGVAAALALPGVVSYSVYLLHYAFVIALRDRDGGPLGIVDPGGANALLNTLLLVVPLSFAVATLAYLVVERPFMAMRGRYLTPPAGQQPEPAAAP